uniref:Uncharacterized protein n=1 Tax=Panstrongylus lignarius TaxID=156445 RepID=A0A224Y602_9HEMI
MKCLNSFFYSTFWLHCFFFVFTRCLLWEAHLYMFINKQEMLVIKTFITIKSLVGNIFKIVSCYHYLVFPVLYP